jgi:hypothetical protein
MLHVAAQKYDCERSVCMYASGREKEAGLRLLRPKLLSMPKDAKLYVGELAREKERMSIQGGLVDMSQKTRKLRPAGVMQYLREGGGGEGQAGKREEERGGQRIAPARWLALANGSTETNTEAQRRSDKHAEKQASKQTGRTETTTHQPEGPCCWPGEWRHIKQTQKHKEDQTSREAASK